MTDLSQSPRVYIRPSPSRGTLGGIARHSNEAVLLCECAGFNLTFIETVGLGQSEIAIADVCDMILLLVPPAGGDELQGLKKGIIEIADMIIVNKADGALISSANHSVAEYRRALQLVRPSFPGVWSPKVLPCSTKERNGFEEIWKNVQDFEKAIRSTGILEKKRMHQRKKLLWSEVQAQLVSIVRNDPRLTEVIRESEFYSQENKISPRSGAYRIIQSFLNHISQHNS